MVSRPWFTVPAGIFDGLLAAFAIGLAYMGNTAMGVIASIALPAFAMAVRRDRTYRLAFAIAAYGCLAVGWLLLAQ